MIERFIFLQSYFKIENLSKRTERARVRQTWQYYNEWPFNTQVRFNIVI